MPSAEGAYAEDQACGRSANSEENSRHGHGRRRLAYPDGTEQTLIATTKLGPRETPNPSRAGNHEFHSVAQPFISDFGAAAAIPKTVSTAMNSARGTSSC